MELSIPSTWPNNEYSRYVKQASILGIFKDWENLAERKFCLSTVLALHVTVGLN